MSLEVLGVSGLVTVQDRGRFGWAHLGVPRAGALDAEAAALANRIVGNDPGAAVLEVTLGSLALRMGAGHWLALTGALAGVSVDGTARPFAEAVYAGSGSQVLVDLPVSGARTYLAVAGGVDVVPVLGSRSTDTLAGLGPARVEVGARLPVGEAGGPPQPHDVPRARSSGPVRVWPGPRADWFEPGAPAALCQRAWTVNADSNRIGLRLQGEPLLWVRQDELSSEGVVLGSIQVPPDGQPVVLLHDHPVTGGYPVLAVADGRDLGLLAQARPGDEVRFVRAR